MTYLRCMRGGKAVYNDDLIPFYKFNKWPEPFPSGVIIFRDDACPSGWTRVSALDNKFIAANANYNAAAGGNAAHTHTMSSHYHAISGNTASVNPTDIANQPTGALNVHHKDAHTHTVTGNTATDGTAATGNGSQTNMAIQTYVKLIICRKD